MSETAFERALEVILAAKRVIVMTHLRPDGDALGSSFGMRSFLRSLGLVADVVMPDEPPERYRKLCSGYLRKLSPEELAAYDLVLLLDCANPGRLGSGGIPVETLRELNFLSVDHHPANSIAAKYDYVDTNACSASEIAARLALKSGRTIPVEAATLWLSGMMTDTGCFRFSNTDGDALRAAASLLDRGAELEKAVNMLFFSKPLRQLQFEAELVERELKLACGGKLAYAFITEQLLASHHFALREDEGLIDLLRSIDGVVIAMLISRQPDGFKISLRSKDAGFPVGPLARSFGGGGHDMAAGITLPAADFDAAGKKMIAAIAGLLGVDRS